MSLSIVIPAYNEAQRIGPMLERIARNRPAEVIVVDDGSSDDTAAIARAGGARVIRYTPNAGKGKAVRTGMLAAAGENIVFMDADGSTDLEAIDRALAERARGFDVVIGSRALPDSMILARQPAYRQRAARIFNVVQQRIAGVTGYGDTQCGFKLYSHRAARAVFSRMQVDGFMFDVEAIAIAERLGFPIIEIPVRWTNDSASRLRIVSDTVRMIPDLARVRWRTLSLPPRRTRGPARAKRRTPSQ